MKCNAGALCVNMQCGGVVDSLASPSYPQGLDGLASESRGVAGSCKMATSDDGVLLGGVEWSSSPVTFHRNKGKNVKLTESNTVATRTKSYGFAIVFTSEPMIVGQMLKVTMTVRVEGWDGGMVRAQLQLVCAVFTVCN